MSGGLDSEAGIFNLALQFDGYHPGESPLKLQFVAETMIIVAVNAGAGGTVCAAAGVRKQLPVGNLHFLSLIHI